MRFLLMILVGLYTCACTWQIKNSSPKVDAGKLVLDELPALLVEDIRQVVAKSDWSLGCAEFTYITYQMFKFVDNSHLVIAEAPDYLCDNSNTYIPIYYKGAELLGWGNSYPGKVNHVVKSDKGHWFLSSYWAIEGTYPMLYQSSDGIIWKEMTLPEERVRDCCFEHIEMMRITKEASNTELLSIRFFNGNELDPFEWVTAVDEQSKPYKTTNWQRR
jgi:hypothetical protein